jgi:hypothetical protein
VEKNEAFYAVTSGREDSTAIDWLQTGQWQADSATRPLHSSSKSGHVPCLQSVRSNEGFQAPDPERGDFRSSISCKCMMCGLKLNFAFDPSRNARDSDCTLNPSLSLLVPAKLATGRFSWVNNVCLVGERRERSGADPRFGDGSDPSQIWLEMLGWSGSDPFFVWLED